MAVPSAETNDEVLISFFTEPQSNFKSKLPSKFELGGLSQGKGNPIDHLEFSDDGN